MALRCGALKTLRGVAERRDATSRDAERSVAGRCGERRGAAESGVAERRDAAHSGAMRRAVARSVAGRCAAVRSTS